MAAPVDAWLAWTMAALNLALAFWWFRGPWLNGTRYWVVGMFASVGVALGLSGIMFALGAAGHSPVGRAFTVVDRWSDFFLLAVAVAALRRVPGHGVWRWFVMGPALAALLAVSPAILLQNDIGLETWVGSLAELPLILALITWAPALLIWLRRPSGTDAWPWLMILGAMGLRYQELALVHFLDRFARLGPDLGAWTTFNHILAGAAAAAVLLAVPSAIVMAMIGRTPLDRARSGATAALLIVGVLLGFAQAQPIPEGGSLVFLVTLGTVRPVAFLLAQASLETGRAAWAGRVRGLVAGVIGMATGLVAITATEKRDFAVDQSILLAISFASLAGLAAYAGFQRLPNRPGSLADAHDATPPTKAEILLAHLYEMHVAGGEPKPGRAICEATDISPKSLAGEVRRAERLLRRVMPELSSPPIKVAAVGVRAVKVYKLTSEGANALERWRASSRRK